MKNQSTERIRNWTFVRNNNATIDLPMKLIVSLIIGSLALIAIIGTLHQFPFPPSTLYVTVSPQMGSINETNNISVFTITILDSSSHKPIQNGLVILKETNMIAYNQTNEEGFCIIPVSLQMPIGINEMYLDVQVKAMGYDLFYNEDMIRIIKQ